MGRLPQSKMKFRKHDIRILCNEGNYEESSIENVIRYTRNLLKESRGGDTLFLYLTGHGKWIERTDMFDTPTPIFIFASFFVRESEFRIESE